MILGQDTVNKIEREVDRRYAQLALILLGVAALTDKEKDLLGSILLAAAAMPVLEHIFGATRKHGGNTLTSLALDQGRREFKEAINNSRDEVKRKIRAAVLSNNDAFRRDSLLQLGKPVKEYVDDMNASLSNSVKSLADNAIRTVTNSMTNFVNSIVAEEAIHESNISGTEAKVYKVVRNDGRQCAWCKSFYSYDTGAPIIYRLKDLAANGSNDGKPKSQWKPVIGSTHPRCRCELFFLKP